MTSNERTLSLIRGIYDAAADDTRWPALLERLADTFGGGVAGFNYRAGRAGVVRSAQFARVEPDILQSIHTYYAARNPWTRLTQPVFRTGDIMAMDALLPASDLRRTEYYAGVLKPVGVQHCFGACVFRRGDDVLTFTAVRPGTKGPYQPNELSHVGVVLPHLQRAVQISSRLKRLERTRAALADALDYLTHGVVLIDTRCRPVFANRAAREIAAARDGFTMTKDEVVVSACDDRRRLRTLLAHAVRTGRGEGFDSGGAITISRPSMKRSYLVVVAPLRLTLDADSHQAVATLFITDPETQAETPEAILRRLFALTATESRVASALAATGSTKAVAERLCIAPDTTRWHLKRIYEKTGTTRQASLVRLLVAGPSQLRLPADAERHAHRASH